MAKCHLVKDQIERPGQRITPSGITPLSNKTDAIQKLTSLSDLKKLRSFMGSVQQLGKFITNLSQFCHSLQPLLKKNTKLVWTDEHEHHFITIKEKIAEATEKETF